MTILSQQDILQDELAISLATATAIANKKASEMGVITSESRLSIRQVEENGQTIWKINYGPKDYINQRGGGLLVEVNSSTSEIKRVLKGQ